MKIRSALSPLLGEKAELIKELDLYFKEIRETNPPIERFKEKVEEVADFLEAIKGATGSIEASRPSRLPRTRNVFIIHGHDELNMRRLSDLLRDYFGLNPIVILSKAGMGRPLIDKFEEDGQICSFTFALFTPDDHLANPKEEYYQARPNVIYETGWFIGRLGRERLVILFKEGTKIHSDLDGVSRIQFREDINEKVVEIQRELQAAKLI
ncbi:MAG: nucleotide-binding protein [Methanotrichaceae archaeon]|nr:nucleotide-binding protein [Methanotrichaceae archaeon]